MEIPMVLDADALYLLQKDLQKDKPLISLCQNCVLTPNANEFARLIDALGQEGLPSEEVLKSNNSRHAWLYQKRSMKLLSSKKVFNI